MMRIALWNGSGINNVGDRLIDAVTRQELQLRLPDAQIQSFSPWPGTYTPQRLTIDTNGYWNGHGEFDAIVVGGGALITGPPFSDPAAQFFLFGPYPERFRDSALVVWNSMCSDGQMLAPSEERWRSFMCSAASKVSLLTVRNSRTRTFLQECGVTSPIAVVPDVAVLAAEPSAGSQARKRLQIGIAPGRPVFPDDFLAEMKANVLAIADRINHDVMRRIRYCPPERFDDEQFAANLAARLTELGEADFFVFGSDCMYGDAITARSLAQKVSDSAYVHLQDPLGADAISNMRSLDCMIAFRLHACILALAAGTPFIAVDLYKDAARGTSKLHEFMQDAGLSARYVTIDEMISGRKRLCNLVEHTVTEGREPIRDAHSRLAAKARVHFDVMAEKIAAHCCVASS